MRYLILNAIIVGIQLNSSKTKLLELVLNVKRQFTIIEGIMVVVNGAHLHLPTQEIFVPNSRGQSLDILGTIFDCLYGFAFVYLDLAASHFLMNHYELSSDVLTRLMIMSNQV